MALPIQYDRNNVLKGIFEAASKKYEITYLDHKDERFREWKAQWDKDYFTPIIVKYKWLEDVGVIATDEEDYNQWLESKPDLVVFEAEIRGVRIETVFVPDVVDENEQQTPIFETRVILKDGDSWSRSNSVDEAEQKHIRLLARILEEGRAKK